MTQDQAVVATDTDAPKAPAKKAVAKKAVARKPAARKAAVKKTAAPVARRAATKVAPAAAAAKAAKADKPAKAVKPVKPVKAAKPVKSDKPAKAAKPAKAKLVRDSFTIPKDEYEALAALKTRALGLEQHVRKSELLRAGVRALAGMSDRAFLAAVKAVPTLKTGRPKSGD